MGKKAVVEKLAEKFPGLTYQDIMLFKSSCSNIGGKFKELPSGVSCSLEDEGSIGLFSGRTAYLYDEEGDVLGKISDFKYVGEKLKAQTSKKKTIVLEVFDEDRENLLQLTGRKKIKSVGGVEEEEEKEEKEGIRLPKIR